MNKLQFFASSNSMMGFQSYFNEIYDPTVLKRLYIIKGGPGTGKSSTIKRVGEYFEAKYKCEYFLCSSDPSSVDGLIIDGKIAVIDGTSPHTTEARYPGAVETLIDNASGISPDIASARKEILELTKEKSIYYKYAYTYLKATGEIKKEHLRKIKAKIDTDKLETAIDRYFKQSFRQSQGYSETIRLIGGITPTGIMYTDGLEAMSNKTTIIINGRGYEEIVHNAILQRASAFKLASIVSFDPLIAYSLNGICLPGEKWCVVKYNKEKHGEIDYDKYKVINFERFISKDKISELKPRLKFAEKCMENLTQEAITNLSKASEIHKSLEAIYSEYTDYSVIDKNTDKIISEISSLI